LINDEVMTGWWFQRWLDKKIHMGCDPKPIDELHDFSRWLSLHHQPDDVYGCLWIVTIP